MDRDGIVVFVGFVRVTYALIINDFLGEKMRDFFNSPFFGVDDDEIDDVTSSDENESLCDTEGLADDDEFYDKDALSIDIKNFSGPLDLLLQLVNAAKIEIKDIFISDITDQFLRYIEQIDVLDVDKASEYMYIAATLTEIKSHDMLPPPEEYFDDLYDDDNSPKRLFIRQLEEYKILKEAAEELKTIENPDRLFKEPSKQTEQVRYTLKDFSLENLLDAFASILNKVEMRELDKNVVREIKKESFSVKDRIAFLVAKLNENDELSFFELFSETVSRSEVVVTFSALLELSKHQFLYTVQDKEFGDIKIVKNHESKGDGIDFEYVEVS